MDIERRFLPGNKCQVPAILIRPKNPHGAAVIVHGYGGSKEEMLGLGFRVAESGLAACVIDTRGHGEHTLPLDGAIGEDLDTAIQFCRPFGKITAIGHSLGGRLALLSDADNCIAISPSLSRNYSERTQETLKIMRSHRVRPPDIATLLAIQEKLPVWDPGKDTKNTLILVAGRDAPEIAEGCGTLEKSGVRVIRISGAMHGDIFFMELTFAAVRDQIRTWYG